MTFLRAEWRKLAIANYKIDESLLKKYVPAGTELDLWNGNCYVSLIGFMFLNTRILGVKIPFHVNFEEVNLRFYVKRLEKGEWKRAVVFIQEIVPKWALSFVANTVYKEHYQTLSMEHHWNSDGNSRKVEYRWKKGEHWHSMKVTASLEKSKLEPNSENEFITEHYWGYSKVNEFKTVEYEVTHPKWETYEVSDYEIDVNFEEVYGPEFAFLDNTEPISVMLAEGSQITVENKKTLKINTINK